MILIVICCILSAVIGGVFTYGLGYRAAMLKIRSEETQASELATALVDQYGDAAPHAVLAMLQYPITNGIYHEQERYRAAYLKIHKAREAKRVMEEMNA